MSQRYSVPKPLLEIFGSKENIDNADHPHLEIDWGDVAKSQIRDVRMYMGNSNEDILKGKRKILSSEKNQSLLSKIKDYFKS